MEKIVHPANSRGFANHGWLQSAHSFSFANYYNPQRIHFGALRVLNDDTIKGGTGFGQHPHDNMEIVTVLLDGTLEHKDSTGRHELIQHHDVQIMSAGSGITHSEFNASKTDPVSLLQLWVFPKLRNITPRYQQQTFDPAGRNNQLQVVVSPEIDSGVLLINQDAWFSLGKFEAGQQLTLNARTPEHGSYLFVINGKLEIAGETLQTRDAIGIWNYDQTTVHVKEPATFLVVDVPMLQ